MSGTEGSVQVQPDSTGKKVRTLDVVTFINGVETTVTMQVIAIADEQGRPLSLAKQQETIDLLYAESRMQTEILLRILNGVDHRNVSRVEMLELLETKDIEQEAGP